MKNKIILGGVLAIIFLISVFVFDGKYMSSETIGYTLGLGALVLGYFGSKALSVVQKKG
jgi:hypothetical protein